MFTELIHHKGNSHEVAQDLHNIQIIENNRIITLDIKDLYVNLPIKNILQVTEFWLNVYNQDRTTIEQTLYLLEIILRQNYFQYNNQFYQPNKGIAMGSPISGTLAEMYLQYLEETHKKHYLENRDIIYYKSYVDDLLIIFDHRKTNENAIRNTINNIDEHLQFKISIEENKITNYLDLSINRNHNSVELNIYKKPTYVGVTIHFSSNHPYDYKLAGFHYYINRMITMPITEQAAKRKWNKIIIMAQNNGFLKHLISRLRNTLIAKKDLTTSTQTKQYHNRKWVIFTCHSPSVHKVTNLFKRTSLKVAFRPTNTVYQQLSHKPKDSNLSGIYQLKCNTCNNAYVGQSGRSITI